jgi:hypothetical protein
MNCQRVKELLPDELAGSLESQDRVEIARHLETCRACREEQQSLKGLWTQLSSLPTLQPSPAMDDRFRTMLEGYRSGLDQAEEAARVRFDWVEWWRGLWPRQPAWQFALVALVFAAGSLAGWSWRASVPERAAAVGGVAELRQEIMDLKEQMALALLQQQSASDRLRGVEATARLESPDDRVLVALLRALDSDPNVNVRLKVVEALQPYARQANVRQTVLASLPLQTSPLVQVELIHFLVENDDKESVPVLKALSESQEIDPTVRERAKWGMAQLS